MTRSATNGGSGSSAGPVVRRALGTDVRALADTISTAMADYAWTRWTVPIDGYLDRVRAIQSIYLTHVALPHGLAWTTHANSAASAFVPASWPDLRPEIFRDLAGLHGERMQRVLEAEAQLAPKRPGHDWTLACVAVHPAHQRAGLGQAVTRAGLAHLDSIGATCLVETCTEANLRFYEGLGWQQWTSVRLERGPVVHVLLRHPG